MARVEILERTEYDQLRDQEIRDAQASRADLKFPFTVFLPQSKVLVIRSIFETKIDAEVDTFR